VVFVPYRERATPGMVILGTSELGVMAGLLRLVLTKGEMSTSSLTVVFRIDSLEEKIGGTNLLKLGICPRIRVGISFLSA